VSYPPFRVRRIVLPSLSCHRPSLLTPLALALLAALALPASLRASCGSHVSSSKEQPPHTAPASPAAPCRGPTCQASHDSLPAAPAPVPVTAEQWGVLHEPITAPDAVARAAEARPADQLPSHQLTPPTPPPRAQAG
jgi:hypothetical protein